MEATGNALATAWILEPHVAEVVLAVPPGGAIGHARAQTEKGRCLAGRGGRGADSVSARPQRTYRS
jgi:hypothetical protein